MQAEINPLIEDQSRNQDLDKKSIAETELAKCLKVDDSGSDCESVLSTKSVKSNVSEKKFVPKTLKTRNDLIRKIQESSSLLGNQEEIKGMRLHRRRKNSLESILKEQIAKCVQKSAEQHLGIPQNEDKRLEYAVKCLYKFDICVLKLVERVVNYCDFGVTVDDLAMTVDSDQNIKQEMHDALRDFIVEGEYSWVKEAASPTTRLLLCHLYPLMSVLRKKEPTKKVPDIIPNQRTELFKAKVKSVIRPPQKNSEPTIARRPLPPGIKMV
jgi:hypothetical protein